MKKYSVVIVGSGIAGMTSAIYLTRAGVKSCIIEDDAPGGQLNRSYIIENYPGYEGIRGPELAENIYKQVQNLDVEYIYDSIKGIDMDNNIVHLDDDDIGYDYLIIATGRRPRKLPFDVSNFISYCGICDGALYKGKDVMVVGSGNSSLEDSLYLSNICKSVTTVLRGDRFKGEEKLIQEVNARNNILVRYNSPLRAIYEKEDGLEVEFTDTKIFVNGLFVCIGSVPNSELFMVDKKDGYIVVDRNMRTNRDNVYAIGDVILKDYYQLTTATGEATIAASEIVRRRG